ncbi:transmembrane and coiled-coil domain-containing protein 4 isoform X2 [Manihot esculenta]|uniref:transmembrane and coiled-coil domain-containing protein 4 isoform X2 n=1 Tax=Manihot esculenta TaxID=3983 RepID=UPI000B5D7909|nr:transmembrane and coiled-coil domain-containing protein 4 isoform X2 [Manihot esculenta]
MASTRTSFLSPTQRYAAGSLFAMALHQAQIHQTRPLSFSLEEDPTEGKRISNGSSSRASVSEDPDLWVHENSALLRPVFRFLEVDSKAWSGLEGTAGASLAKHHVGAYLRLLSEDGDNASSQSSDQELALSKAVDAIAQSMEPDAASFKYKKEKHQEYEHECREKLSAGEVQSHAEAVKVALENAEERDSNLVSVSDAIHGSASGVDEKPIEEEKMLSYHRKITVLYELLSACLADKRGDNKNCTRRRKGYDARHRVALRLLATWLDIKWIKMEAIETTVAWSAMATAKEEAAKEEASQSTESKWAKWRRGGIIGAAAITGGTLMAITGGLAAPAIAAGFSALAPTLGTLIPVIGASGFAAAATAAGTVAGSVAVAASFGAAGAGLAGAKMARRTGSVDEFEFKAIGENQKYGRLAVEILISGFVFNEEDFIRPWEGQNDNLERYSLQWESKNLIAVSTSIQDWLTSRIALEIMRQGAMMTVLSTLLAALAWPAALLAATNFIDSKWTIAIDRSDKAGKLLAEVLLKGLQGNRPVTLVGYSLGARVVFKCLETLAETEHHAEVIERVVLLGAPIAIKDEKWEAARKLASSVFQMVAGRFVNAYSTNDWILGLAFRASLLTQGLAGIQPIAVPGIENVDVTDIIEGHSSYLWATQQILEQLELDAYYPVFGSIIHHE